MTGGSRETLERLVRLIYIIIVVVAVIFLFPKAVSCLLPFLLAWIISLIIRPCVHLFEKTRIGKRASVILSMLVVLVLLGAVLYYVSGAIVGEVRTFVKMLGDTRDGIPMFVWDTIDSLPKALQDTIIHFLENFELDFSGFVLPAITAALPKIGGVAGKLPGALVFIVVFLLATYFLSYDEAGLRAQLKKILPEGQIDKLRNIRNILSDAVGGYVKAQLIMMCIVFTMLFIGFAILDVELALLLAIIISILDAVPVLGTGMVLNPMAVVFLIQGDYVRALGFVIIYAVVVVVRNFVEPRVLSGQLGIHPIITLASMYTGFKLAGILGMIIGPLLAIIIINIAKINREAKENARE